MLVWLALIGLLLGSVAWLRIVVAALSWAGLSPKN